MVLLRKPHPLHEEPHKLLGVSSILIDEEVPLGNGPFPWRVTYI
jgi:hypothetical protein